jgi:fructose transport system ATP-binding protein
MSAGTAMEDLSAQRTRPPVLEARGLVKRYGRVTALDRVDFELRAGEILAVIGDNGAGKSSLIMALSGAMIPDEGELRLDGRPVRFHSPIDARRHGIETVYQGLAVAPAMTVAENLFLGRELVKPGLPVETLSGGERQGVAVARSAAFARHVVIMDEPTAALGVKEGRMVLELIRRVRAQGLAVILISHNMPHVFDIADRIHIQRLGRRAAVVDPRRISMADAVAVMTGARSADELPPEVLAH